MMPDTESIKTPYSYKMFRSEHNVQAKVFNTRVFPKTYTEKITYLHFSSHLARTCIHDNNIMRTNLVWWRNRFLYHCKTHNHCFGFYQTVRGVVLVSRIFSVSLTESSRSCVEPSQRLSIAASIDNNQSKILMFLRNTEALMQFFVFKEEN